METTVGVDIYTIGFGLSRGKFDFRFTYIILDWFGVADAVRAMDNAIRFSRRPLGYGI